MCADKVLMTVSSPDAKLDMKLAAEILGVSQQSLDADFGIVSLDPDHGLYAVKVEAQAVQSDHPTGSTEKSYRGPFSNPRIEVFGRRRK
jgi:hypothetical protein